MGELVGFGVVGLVRMARYLPTGLEVHLETIPDHLASDPGFAARLGELGAKAAAVRDAHVVAAYEVLSTGSKPRYVVTEPFEEESLSSQAPDGRGLPESEACEIADGVLAAVEAIHAAGLVHGGVSRATILRGSDRRVRLCGLPLTAVVATHPDDRHADLVAAGGVLARLLQEPLPGSTKRRHPSRRLARLVRQGQRRPPAGFATAAQMLAALRRTAPGPAERAGSRGPRRWLVRGGVAAATVAAGIAVGLALNTWVLPEASASALQVRSVSLDVSAVGSCSGTYRLVATGSLAGTGPLVYRWDASGDRSTGDRSLQIASGVRSFSVTQLWQPSASQDQPSISFQVVRPAPMTITRSVDTRCP